MAFVDRFNPLRPKVETDLKLGTGSEALKTYRSYIEKILQQLEIVTKNFNTHREDLKKSNGTLQTEIRNDVQALREGIKDLNLERDELNKVMDAFTTERKTIAAFIGDARKIHTYVENLKLKTKKGTSYADVDKYLALADTELRNKEDMIRLEEKNIENILNNAVVQEKKIIPWLAGVDATIKRVEGMEVVDQKELQNAINRDDNEIKAILQISARLKALQSKSSTGFVNTKELESILAEVTALRRYLLENNKFEEKHMNSIQHSKLMHTYIKDALVKLGQFKLRQDKGLKMTIGYFKKEQDDITRVMSYLKTVPRIIVEMKSDPTLKKMLDKY